MTYTAHEIKGGYYETYKRVEVARRLHYMPYAQAGWREERGSGCAANYVRLTMFSYSSAIFHVWYKDGALFTLDTQCVDAAINYSRTTSRQVTAAMQELGLCGGEIAALKRFFIRGGKCACVGGDSWLDAETGAVIWEGVRG